MIPCHATMSTNHVFCFADPKRYVQTCPQQPNVLTNGLLLLLLPSAPHRFHPPPPSLSSPLTFLRPADSCSDLQLLSSASPHSITSVICELVADQFTDLLRWFVCDVYVRRWTPVFVNDVASQWSQVSSLSSAVRRSRPLAPHPEFIESRFTFSHPCLYIPQLRPAGRTPVFWRLRVPSSLGTVCLWWEKSFEILRPTLRFVLHVGTRTSLKSRADKEAFDLVGAEGEGCYSLR